MVNYQLLRIFQYRFRNIVGANQYLPYKQCKGESVFASMINQHFIQ